MVGASELLIFYIWIQLLLSILSRILLIDINKNINSGETGGGLAHSYKEGVEKDKLTESKNVQIK